MCGKRPLFLQLALKFFPHATFAMTFDVSKFGIFRGLFAISKPLNEYNIKKLNCKCMKKLGNWFKNHISVLVSMFRPYRRKGEEFQTRGAKTRPRTWTLSVF